jgi:hypothetical protein
MRAGIYLGVTSSLVLLAVGGCAVDNGNGPNNASGGGSGASGGTSSASGGSTSTGTGGNGSGTGGSQSASGGTSGNAGGSTGSGGSGGNPPPEVPNEFCAAMAYEEDVTVADSQTDRFSWNDASCLPRTASMARMARGYLRQFTYMYDGDKQRTATGTGVNGHMGWGFPVNHGLGALGGNVNPSTPGAFGATYVGPHHSIYRYRIEQGGIIVTLEWFFASGRNNPVIGITYDMNGAGPGLGGDMRTPYGDIAWDGDENFPATVISGIGWGDRYKFKTTTAPFTRNSSWDYTEPNLVPYVHEWADASDTEMGVVQTQTYLQKDAGGYWFYKNWGKTSENQDPDDGQVGKMPLSWNWPYQMNQYELCYPEAESCVDQPTSSHRLAWGANYGAAGGTDASGMYPAYGDDKQLSGYPFASYSVIMVMGKHSEETVFQQVREIETVQKTSISATTGSVVTELPAGVARTDMATLSPAGYDARYSTWNVSADQNKAAFSVSVSEGALRNPVLVVSNYTGAEVPGVSLDGKALVPDVDYLASLDPATQKLWITLRAAFQGTRQISIE